MTTLDDWSGWVPDRALLQGKVGLVAGGGGGIGEATSRILAAAGATVAVVDNDGDAAERISKRIVSSGGRALPVVADLREEKACAGAVERVVSEFGGIDVLTNVAGGMSRHAPWRPVHEWPTDTWDAIVHLNLRYVFWMCREAIPSMQARGGGAIVNVASIAGAFGSPNQSAYGAAKAGLINLTKTLALEYGPAGIRVNAVSPGVTLTREARAAMDSGARTAYSDMTPLRELGEPEDIARAILYFASPMAHHVTGQMLLVDGGIGVTFPYHGLGSDA
ncbi:MAG: SDR family oxidoreductase [Acidimicrobiaceae bacterium]|nr:SDR family oxidoreductase [Acidimicrobiaceae bacterium]